jgi:transcriptional regulator with XRE-family HTH domain
MGTMEREFYQSKHADGRLTRVGPRLRELRLGQDMTLAVLAERTGLTKGFLSLVERGRASTSVPALLSICDALGTTISALFEYPDEEVVRSGRGAPLQMGGNQLEEFLLTPAGERHVQVMRTVLQPGGGSGGAYTLPIQTVFAYVVSGRLELTVAGQSRLLDAGDATTFSARAQHAWCNAAPGPTEVLWALAPALPAERAMRGAA